MIILSFLPDACEDCHRPPNAGGCHNAGCKLSFRRFCDLCQSAHDNGDDVHRDTSGAWCTIGAATARTIARCPGWTRERCEDEIERIVSAIRIDLDVYSWIKANPLAEHIIIAATRATMDR